MTGNKRLAERFKEAVRTAVREKFDTQGKLAKALGIKEGRLSGMITNRLPISLPFLADFKKVTGIDVPAELPGDDKPTMPTGDDRLRDGLTPQGRILLLARTLATFEAEDVAMLEALVDFRTGGAQLTVRGLVHAIQDIQQLEKVFKHG